MNININMSSPYECNVIAGVDIGGSHIGIGLLLAGPGEKRPRLLTTPITSNAAAKSTAYILHQNLDPSNEPSAIVLQIATIIKQMVDTVNSKARESQLNVVYRLVSVGIGCPGQSKEGILVGASNLPTFKNFPLAASLRDALGLSHSLLLNDADAAMASEFFGSVDDKYTNIKDACMITLGTGIGMGVIINGKLHHGSNGLIEGGHMIIPSNLRSKDVARIKEESKNNNINISSASAATSTTTTTNTTSTTSSSEHIVCGCGQIDCVEAYASARNTAMRLHNLDVLTDSKNSKINSSKNLNFGAKEVFARASQNDVNALEVVEGTSDYLAILCLNICRLIDPAVIIFGGGMSLAGNDFLAKIKISMSKLTWTVLKTEVNLVLASSIEDGGVYGAALAAFQDYKNKNGHPQATSHVPVASTSHVNFSSEAPLFTPFSLISLMLGGIAGYMIGSRRK